MWAVLEGGEGGKEGEGGEGGTGQCSCQKIPEDAGRYWKIPEDTGRGQRGSSWRLAGRLGDTLIPWQISPFCPLQDTPSWCPPGAPNPLFPSEIDQMYFH